MGSVVVWRDGRKRTIKIKQESTGTADKHEAQAILHQIETRYRRGNIENRDAPATFSDLVTAYLDAGKSDRYLLNIVRRIGDLAPEDLTQAFVDKEARAAYPSASPATLRRQWHGVISAVLRHSKCQVLFDKPQGSKPTTKWNTAMQADAIIEQVAKNPRCTSRQVALAEFLFGTGCRSGEAVTLLGRDVSLVHGFATFRDTKNGWERTVPLPARTLKAMKAMVDEFGIPDADTPFFRKPNGLPYTKEGNRGAKLRFLESAAAKLDLTFNPHMARHSFATWFYSQTSDKRFLREIGGWRSDAIVDRYAHFVPKSVGKDAKKYGWDFKKMIEQELERDDDDENYA